MSGSPRKIDWPTLITTYICSFVSLSFIFIRLLCRRMRGERFMSFLDDVWMSISIIPLILRLGMVHIVIVNGTNSVTPEVALSLTAEDMDKRILGSRLVLGTRVAYPAFLWCMKACILAFLSRLMSAEPKYARAIRVIGFALILSFIGVIMGTFLECHPFGSYFMMPGPKCTKAFVQLTTMATLNIATDLVLIILPLPFIFKSHLPILRKVQLSLLFTVSFAVIIVTVVRMPLIVESTAMQKSRTLWASIEILTSCIVANAPILNTFYYEWKKKRRGGSRKHTQMTGDQEADEDDDFNRSAYSMKSKPSPKIHLKRSKGSSGGGDQYSSTGSRTGKGHARDLSEESLTRSDDGGEREFVIETTTQVTQSVSHASPDTLRNQQSRYYKGDFLGTQVWADQVFPGPKDPTQHLNYGMNLSHQKPTHHHHTSSYNHNKRPSHTFTDIPSLGVLPSTPPRALLNAIANRKTVQNRANAESKNGDPSSSSSSSQGGGILRSFGRRGSRAMPGSQEELGSGDRGLGIDGLGGSGGSSSSRSLASDGGALTPGIEMEHQHHYQHKSMLG